MSRPEPSPHTRLLRWYPASWRARYGDELTALLEDTYGDGPIPWRTRAATAKAGVVQHLRASGLSDRELPADRARNGSLLVLCGWAFFVVAGAMLAKFNEHWDAATPQHDRWLPTTGYIAIEAAAALGLLIVLAAGLLALPALLRSLRIQGWALVRRQVLRVGAAGLATVGAGIPVVIWAHHLTSHQRNGGLAVYSAVFLVVGFLVVATIATVTASVVSIARRLELSTDALRWLARLAFGLVGVMVTVVGGTALWWVSLAIHAPSVLGGRAPLDLILIGALMAGGMALSALGAVRVARSWNDLHAGAAPESDR